MTGLPLRIIVGLGNPGPEHRLTRHNAGFWFVDLLARRHGAEFRDYRKYSGETARISVAGRELTLLKPTTYMNRSGVSIRQLGEFFKIPSEAILVAHDELDLPAGSVRLKQGGGHGGHNGLRDTIAHIGDAFWRLRFGIGHPGNKSEVIDYVLTRAPAAEEDLILEAINTAADYLPLLIEHGAERAMTKLHSRARSEPAARKAGNGNGGGVATDTDAKATDGGAGT
jgi:PTH1 family peptidyl-tRNA hydrolase